MTEQPPRTGYRFLRFLVRVIFRVYFRGRVIGRENLIETGGVLIVSNHQSFLDPPLIGAPWVRECCYMARDTLWNNRFLGRLLTYVNVFPVRRGEADITAVKGMLRRLRQGEAVLVFPEGTRSRDGSLGVMNPNTLSFAKKAGVAILPVRIEGTFKAWPPGRRLPRPRKVSITYTRPITAEQVRERSLEQIVEIVTQQIEEAGCDG
ncbi:MAG: lysophospholipid acyltransferase family protein [Phycisphaerae bacterium]